MSDPHSVCSSCGTPLTTSARGLCPRCLLADVWNPLEEANEEDYPLDYLRGLFPNLTIERMLARGGMGTIYLVNQTTLDRQACLKILSPTLSANPEFVERFKQEAKVIGGLDNPNIVTVFDASQVEGVLYILMEYVEGMNLKDYAKSEKLVQGEVLKLMDKITQGLAAAHQKGVVHRDIKPANILVTNAGVPKVGDFGLAKLVNEDTASGLTSVGLTVGTPRYMSPEQWDSPDTVDARSDVYSLGVVFYELATGRLPTGQFKPPSVAAGKEFDTRFDLLLGKSLESRPEDRYQDAVEFHAQLQAYRAPSFGLKTIGAAVLAIGVIGAGIGYVLRAEKPTADPMNPESIPSVGSTLPQLATGQSAVITGDTPSASLGRAVAIVDELMIVGAPEGGKKGTDITGSGYALIVPTANDPTSFRMELGEEEPIVLKALNGQPGDRFGYDVAAGKHRTGKRFVVIGVPGANEGAGRVDWYYENEETGWDLQPSLNILKPLDCIGDFGTAVAVSPDGEWLIAGASKVDAKRDGMGCVQVYRHSETDGWKGKLLQKPVNYPALEADHDFGYSVDIDDRFFVVGSPSDGSVGEQQGSVFVYSHDRPEPQVLIDPNGKRREKFGYRVDLEGDWLAVTSISTRLETGMDKTGAVHVFRLENADWKFHQTLVPAPSDYPAELTLERFGYGLKLGDGLLAAGAPATPLGNDLNYGIAFVYKWNPDADEWQKRLLIRPQLLGSRFGSGIAFGKDFLALGAVFSSSPNAYKAGAVFCFDENVVDID